MTPVTAGKKTAKPAQKVTSPLGGCRVMARPDEARKAPDGERHQRQPDEAHQRHLGPQRLVGPCHGQHADRDHDHQRHRHQRDRRPDDAQRLGETVGVEGDREGLRQEEGHADGAAELEAEAAGDDEVGAAGTQPGVGGHRRERQRGDEGDGVGQHHHHQHPEQPEVSHQPAEAQVHDHAEDGQDGGREDPDEGAELAVFCHAPPLRTTATATTRRDTVAGFHTLEEIAGDASPAPVSDEDSRLKIED